MDGRELIIQEHWTYIKHFSPLIFIFLKNMFFFYFCREKREEELEYFMTKKYNRLGSKIQTRNTTLSNIVTDPDLLLKWTKIIFLNFLCLHLISEYLCTVTISNLNTFNFLSWKKPVKENVCYKLFWKIDGMLEENF